jgi:hypothetical protein|tara:strand:+ start:1065 stop:1298 length:234 start_codon:yes stop_codon:yes gene_type:complete
MTDHRLEDDESVPLWEACRTAGQYLDSIKVHDIRYLNRDQLMMLGSIIISTFAEQRAEWFENRRHKDDTFANNMGLG